MSGWILVGLCWFRSVFPKTLTLRSWGFFQKRDLQDAAFYLFFFFFSPPLLLFNLLETLVHVALLVRLLWSENISESSLLADRRQELWSCEVMDSRRMVVFLFVCFLPAQQSLLKIKFIYYRWLTSVKESPRFSNGRAGCVCWTLCAISLAFHKSIKTCCSPGPLCASGMSVFVNVYVSISLPFLVLFWSGLDRS